MLIEADARRFITDAIQHEKELCVLEKKMKGRIVVDNNVLNEKREKLVILIAKINSVANIEGTGRDDLTLSILSEAECIVRRISSI
jgi:hypothetical protein